MMCGSIAGCVVMHPFFAYMQMVGVYDIEQRCGQRLIAEGRLPVAITKGAHILRISHITRLDTFLEPQFTDAHIRHRTVKSVRWATL